MKTPAERFRSDGERRISQRLPVDLFAHVTFVEPGGAPAGIAHSCRVVDLAKTGCRLIAPEAAAGGMTPRARVRVALPRNRWTVDLFEADVRWTRRRVDGRAEAGLRFTTVTEDAQRAIADILDNPSGRRRHNRASHRYEKATSRRRRAAVTLVAVSIGLGLALTLLGGALPDVVLDIRDAAIRRERQLLEELARRQQRLLLQALREQRALRAPPDAPPGQTQTLSDPGGPRLPRPDAETFTPAEREALRRMLQDAPPY